MAFTVTRPGGTKDGEFAAYARLLEKRDIDLTRTPRTPEPGTENRWLYVWEDREAAEAFAQELRKGSRDKAWIVREVSSEQVSEGPLGPVEIDVALGELFSRAFPEDPEGAIDYLRQQVHRGSSRQAAAEVLLPYTVKASYAQQNLVCAALLELATPEDLIHAALVAYGRNEDPRLLQEAAGLLERSGPAAWPALAGLAASEKPECRYFVAAIAGLAGVAEEDRQQALVELAHNADVSVRHEVVEILEGGCLSNAGPVWEVLAHDRDEQIASIASDQRGKGASHRCGVTATSSR